MPYKLGEEISFCWAGDRAVFLDASQDRYFCLGRSTEAIFRKLCADEWSNVADASRLVDLKVINAIEGEGARLKAVNHIKPTRSVLEEKSGAPGRNVGIVLETAFAVASARRRLRQRPLLDIIKRRRARKPPSDGAHASATEAKLELANAFSLSRRMVPIPSVCLSDSIALLDLLARRGLAADLVFGVKLNPFAAHCWVQAGDVVLNETVECVRRHTEILVV
jgi:hypothetical protein